MLCVRAVSSGGGPQGDWPLSHSQFFINLCTSSFQRSPKSCDQQKHSDDSAVVVSMSGEQESKHRELVEHCAARGGSRHFILYVNKMKEMIVEHRKEIEHYVPPERT